MSGHNQQQKGVVLTDKKGAIRTVNPFTSSGASSLLPRQRRFRPSYRHPSPPESGVFAWWPVAQGKVATHWAKRQEQTSDWRAEYSG